MKKLKLKSWVVPALYIVSLSIIFVSIVAIGRIMATDYEQAVDNTKVPGSVTLTTDDVSKPVVEVITNEKVVLPYTVETVSVAKDFYESDASEESQIQSLIYYKNTYMENTGILYTANEEFDVVSSLDGTVTSITDDEILGKVVEISHSTELITIYHCLKEVKVNVGDAVTQGTVVGVSGPVNIDNSYDNALLFEVNYQGQIMNPNNFYTMSVKDLLN